MGKVNSLFQDEQARKAAEWLKANPAKTEEDAYFALHPDFDEEPQWPAPWELYERDFRL